MAPEEAALTDPRAFKQLEERLYADKRWSDLVEAYASRAMALEDLDQRERLLFQAGQLAEQKLQDPKTAGGYYRRAFDVRKTFVRALSALRALHADRKDHKAITEVLGLEIEATPEAPKKAKLHKELGDALAAQEGVDPEEPIKAYAKALELDPKQRPALVELEKLCRKHSKWNKLVGSYKRLADTTTGKESAVFHFFAGTILDEKLKQYEFATRAFRSALEAKPDKVEILGAIATFFEKRKAWDDAIAANEALVPLHEAVKDKAKVLRKIAAIAEKNKNDLEAAAKHYRRAVGVRPDDAEALAKLKEIAELRKDDAGAAEALELEAFNLELSPDDKGDRLEKAAERREKAGDVDKAIANLTLVIELKPRAPRALKALERLTRKLGRWPEHARSLELQAALLDPKRSPEERQATIAVEKRLAEVKEQKLNDPKAALASLSRILAIDPDDQDTLSRVETLARKQKDWARVAQALARRVDKAKDDAARAKLAAELGQVREDQLDDAKGAAEAWEDALARDRSVTDRALASLRRLYEKTKDHVGLAKTLRRLVDAAQAQSRPTSWRAQLLRDLGASEHARGEHLAASRALVEAIAVEPEGEGATAARRLLVEADRARGDAESLRRSLADLAARDADAAVARGARLELARLEEKANRPADAIKILEEQLALVPADDEALPHAARLLAALGSPLEAVEKLQVASRSIESADALKAASFEREAARILEKEQPIVLGPGGAVSAAAATQPFAEGSFELRAKHAWGRVLDLNPEDDAAAERYADLCRRSNDAAGLDVVLERAASRAADPTARARLNKERAALAKGALARPADAAALYERVLKDAPTDGEATAALLQLYRALERWLDLADLLEAIAARDLTGAGIRATDRLELKKLEGGAVPEPLEALREAATISAEKLQELPRAVACLERLIERSPDDDDALSELARYLRGMQRPRDLERILEKRAALAEEANDKADLLLERGAVLEKELQDFAAATRAYEKSLEARKNDRRALEGLARVRSAVGDAKGAVEALALAAQAALAEGDASGAASIELTRGDIARNHRDLAAAEAAYRGAIARAPSLTQAHDALATLLSDRADWPGLEKALAEAAETSQGARRAELLVRRADVLASRIGRGDDALLALDAAATATPDSELVLEARARVLRQLNRAGPLADALAARRALETRRRRAGPDPALSGGRAGKVDRSQELQIGLLREEAHLRAFGLDQLPAARELLDQARKLAPRDPGVIADLVRVERRASTRPDTADADRHLELLRAYAAVEDSPRKKSDLLCEAARCAKVKKGDAKTARALFVASLQAEPGRLEAMRWLQGLAREADDQDELAQWLEKEAEVEVDPHRRALVQARLGDAHRRRNKPEAARKSYEAALQDEPNHAPALRHLAPLLRRAKEWPKLAEVLERLARVEQDKHARRERLVMLGEVRLRRLEDAKGARAAFDEALAIEPDDLDALRGRARTLDPKKDAKELVETLSRELQHVPQAARRADLHKRVGELRLERLNDLEGAAKAFAAAIRIRPDDDEARAALRQVYVASHDWPKLARAYEDEARRETRPAAKEERFRQAALIRHHHLNEVEKAIVLYKEVLNLGDPECLAVELLPRLLAGRDDERLEVLKRIADIVPGSRQAEEALLELGRVHEDKGDRAAAQSCYERLLDRNPTHPRALDALVALHRAARDLPRLADALARKIGTLPRDQRGASRLDRGAVLEELRDLDGAAREYEEAAAEDARAQEPVARLRTVYARTERWPELVRALALAVERSQDTAGAAKLLLEKAAVEEKRLDHPRDALETLKKATALVGRGATAQPGQPASSLSLEVSERLVELVRALDLPDELAEALEQRAQLVPKGQARARVLAEVARVYDARLDRPEAAIDAWNRCLDESPDDRAALAALQEVCARTRDRRGRARALEREIDLLLQKDPTPPADLERLVTCALEAARIHEELDDLDAAVRALERALDRDAGSKAVFEELARIYAARGHEVTLYDLLRRRVRATNDAAEQGEVRERMAVLAEALGDDEGAIADWNEVLVRRPKELRALAALLRLHLGREEWTKAAEVSEREIAVVSELSGSGARAAADPIPDLAELHLALADLAEKRLEDADRAVQQFELAHARAPRDPRPLRGVERLRLAAQDWAAVSRARAALRDLEDDPAKRASLALGVAAAEEKLGRRADAIAALRGALEDVPDNAVALALLRGHLLDAERWADAAQVLAREADVARERDTQVARRLQRAALLRDKLSDAAGAAADLELARGLDPSNLEALRGLEALYEKSGEREKLAGVLDDLARVEVDPGRAADLLVREGRTLAPDSGADEAPAARTARLERARGAFERALLRVPERADAVDELIALFEKLAKPRELAQALHRRADLAASAAERARFLRRAAEIEERSLEDPEVAARTLERLSLEAQEPLEWDLDGTLAELARLRGALGQHAARELALKLRTSLAKTPDAKRTLLLERARLLEEQLARPGAAAECVAQVLELFPQDAAIADELARLREAAGDAIGVVAAIDHALGLLPAGDRGPRLVQLHRKRGQLCAGAAYDPDKAIASFTVLLGLNADDDAAREALEAILAREGRAKELVVHLAAEVARRRAKGTEPRELAGLERRRAELLRGPLADEVGAEQAYRAALALDPDDARAREGLEALLRASGKQEALATLLAENAARAPNDVVAAEALREEAQVHEQRGDRKAAIVRLETALGRVNDDRRTLRALVRLYRLEERSEDLARILSELVRALGSQPPAERAAVLVERGLVLARELGRADEAEESLDEALDLDSRSVPAARALAPLLVARQAWKDVVRVYELEAQAGVDRPRRTWLRNEIGRIRRDHLKDEDGATRAFQEALALDATSVTALVGLASVLRSRGRSAELAVPLERLAELAPSPEDRLGARRELAHLLEEKLGEPAKAAERYRAILAEDGRDADATRGLVRCLRAQISRLDPERAKPQQVLPLKAYLVDAIERELPLESEGSRRFALLMEAAALHEALADEGSPDARKKRLEATARCAREATELRPEDAEALASYARVAEKLGRWKELVEATERLAGVVDDKARSGWMFRRAGKLRAHRLSDAAGAAAAFERALAVDPKDREALEALEPLARELRDVARLTASLRGQLAIAPDDVRRSTIALRLGEAYESVQDYPRAIEAYVLSREKGKAPQRKDAQKALDRCFRATERWTDLARVLDARVQSEPENAAALLLERAKVCEERLARHDKAAEALREALRIDGENANAARSLERVLAHVERWDELAEFYESDAARRGPRGYDVLVKLGKLYRDKLDDPERAAAALQTAATLNPAALDAIEALRDVYLKVERWPELLEVLRLEVALVKEPRQREARFLRAARIAEEKLGDLAQAARFYLEASQLSPADRAHLASLARVQEARGDVEGLVRTLERDLALARDPQELVGLRKRLGHVYAKGLYRKLDAVLAYREALAVDPDDDEALAALADLYRDSASWDELARVLERRATRARGKEALAIRLELARTLAGKLNRAEEALRMATAARSIDPRSPDAIAIEVEVLRGLGRNDELAEALARLAAVQGDARERSRILVELAKHLETVLKRPDRALRALEEALSHDPANEDAIARATALQEAAGRWDDLLDTFERAHGLAATPQKRAVLRARSAEVLEKRKGDAARAERLFREALAEDATHVPAVAGLARVLHGTGAGGAGADPGRAAELEKVELRRAELERDPVERARALARAGTVCRDALHKDDAARAHYEKALESAPDLFEALAPLAEVLYGRDDLKTALALLERVAVSPEIGHDAERAAELLHALALCREHKGDREGAAAALKRALEFKASHPQVLEDLARLLCEDGAFEAAIPILEDLVQRTRVQPARATHELSLARALAKTTAGDRALELFRRGLERVPEDAKSRLAYAELLGRRNDHAGARREYERLIAATDSALAAKARIALADLFDGPLNDPEAGVPHLRHAVEIAGDHQARAARRLAELHARAERWQEAAQQLARACELEPEIQLKAELWAKLGRLFRDRLRNLELARRCLEKSFELIPTDRHTLDSLARLLESSGDFEALEAFYGKAADAAREKKLGDEAALRLRRAEVVWKRLKRAKVAAKEYEAVLAIEPGHTGARAALAQVYLETGDVKGTERIFRAMLREDPLVVDHYRALAHAWREGGVRDAWMQALQPIAVLQAATEEEQRLLGQRSLEKAVVARRGLTAEHWRKIVHPDAQGPLFEMIAGLPEAFERQIPEDLKSYGLGMLRRSLPLEGDAFPEHRLVKRVSDLMGIEDGSIELYWMADWKRPEAILAHSKKMPALILCPTVFQGLSEAEKVFTIARALAPVPSHLEAARAMPTRELERFAMAAIKTLAPDAGFSFSGEEEKDVRAFSTRVAKLEIPDRVRAAASELAKKRDKLNVESFRRAAVLTASRAGVLAAGGAHPAVLAVVKQNVAMRGRLASTTTEVVRDFREVAELRDILEFSVSEGYLEVRKALGLVRD